MRNINQYRRSECVKINLLTTHVLCDMRFYIEVTFSLRFGPLWGERGPKLNNEFPVIYRFMCCCAENVYFHHYYIKPYGCAGRNTRWIQWAFHLSENVKSFFAWYKSKQYPYFNSVTSARARVYLPYRFPILRRTNIATFEGCVAVTWRPMHKTKR